MFARFNASQFDCPVAALVFTRAAAGNGFITRAENRTAARKLMPLFSLLLAYNDIRFRGHAIMRDTTNRRRSATV